MPHRAFDIQSISDLIRAERNRQDERWGPPNNTDATWLAVLTEEVGEAARAILARDGVALEEELIQVAAVTIAWIEDRRNHTRGPVVERGPNQRQYDQYAPEPALEQLRKPKTDD